MDHKCPNCQSPLKFGIQRCIVCGTWIFWNSKKDPEIRTQPISWPQKAEVIHNAPVTAKSEAGNPIRTITACTRVIVTGAVGDFYALESGGWVHRDAITLWGQLPRLTVIDPTGNTPLINVLDLPKWPGGNILYTVKPGDLVRVWEVTPDWIRIGNGQWLALFWISSESRKKIAFMA